MRQWLAENLPEGWGAGGYDGPRTAADRVAFARQWQRKLYDGGWAAITWAPEHGGRGGTPAQALIFREEAARFDETNGFLEAAISLIGPALIRFGSDAQRERFLPPMLRGD